MREFDSVDRAILAALRNDARISNKALADLAGIAPSTCLPRVARLEQDGVLIGYHAELEPRTVGIGGADCPIWDNVKTEKSLGFLDLF